MLLALKNFLYNHPFFGAICSIGSFILPYVEMLTPYLQFAGLLLGVMIGLLTLWARIEERVEKRKKSNER